MTVRSILQKRYRRGAIGFTCGFALFVVGGMIHQARGAGAGLLVVPMVLGFAVAFLSGLSAAVVLRCPVCRTNLYGLLMVALVPRLRFDRIDPRIQCCPYCKQNFDAELPAR